VIARPCMASLSWGAGPWRRRSVCKMRAADVYFAPSGHVSCLRIDRTRVADENTILFHMRGGDVYRNDLETRCPNIESEQGFMYRTTLNQLCDSDVVTVLDDIGFGFMPGASCGLGNFRPIRGRSGRPQRARTLTGGALRSRRATCKPWREAQKVRTPIPKYFPSRIGHAMQRNGWLRRQQLGAPAPPWHVYCRRQLLQKTVESHGGAHDVQPAT